MLPRWGRLAATLSVRVAGSFDQVPDALLEVGLDYAQTGTLCRRQFGIDLAEKPFLHGSELRVDRVDFPNPLEDVVI